MRTGITGILGVLGKNNNGKRVVEFFAEKGCVRVTRALSTRVSLVHKGDNGPRWSVGIENNRSGAGEEGYATLCVECEGSERDVRRPVRSPCCIV